MKRDGSFGGVRASGLGACFQACEICPSRPPGALASMRIATAGTASSALGGLFAAGSGAWTLIPSLALPIFDGGARQGALDYARAQQEAGLAAYDKAIQTAFREVVDALAERASLGQRLGAESALAVLDAQRTLWTAQQELVALQLTEQGNRLTLFKALGGA